MQRLVLGDLSAAFETVEQTENLDRTNYRTVRKLFSSDLEERWYFMTIGSFESDWMAMTCGVLQGSILETLLLSLYINVLWQELTIYLHVMRASYDYRITAKLMPEW